MNFRSSLIRAAEEAFDNGQITRFQLVRIRLASIRRAEEIQTCCEEELQKAGKMPAAGPGGIDWMKFLAFLKEILPIILMFI